jgi:4-oxalocrotonate tautomerase
MVGAGRPGVGTRGICFVTRCAAGCVETEIDPETGPDWRARMPLLNVKIIEGVFSPSQKQEMIRKLTDTMLSIEGEAMRSVTWVVIEEVKSGDWGIGGNPLSTNDVKALAAGKSKG